jgi:hypothetical protein
MILCRKARAESSKVAIGLFSTQFDANLKPAMNRWSFRQGFALLLAVFVTVGMGLSVVRANDMAVKMAMMSDMGADGQDDCANCLHLPDKAGAKATFCAAVCAAPAIAHQHEAPPRAVALVATIRLANVAALHGRALQPDPHPPRTSDIA